MIQEQTELNDYGMDSRIRDSSVIYEAERLIRHGEEPRRAYERALKMTRPADEVMKCS